MGFKIPRPDKWIPKPPKIPKPKLPDIGRELRHALEPIYDQIHSVRKVVDTLEGKVHSELTKALDGIEKEVNSAIDKVKKEASETAKTVAELEKNIGDQIARSLSDVFGELVELSEKGILKDALDKIAAVAETEVFEGSAPIVLRTAYLDIELTDAKLLARTIRDMVKEGVPTSKREWRYIIIDLAPVAIEIKPGIPLIAQLTKKIPLKNLERKALEELLKKAGL